MVIYEGPSLINGRPIVAIATVGSSNAKTGPMVQTWILPADMSPVDAVRNGADESVCGDCPQRHYLGGHCYVLPFQAPRSVYMAWKRGTYDTPKHKKRVLSALIASPLRIGAYGDPAAIPVSVWARLAQKAPGRTGYTHQWRKCDPELARYCMASCDTPQEAIEARAKGWRVFLVGDGTSPIKAVECLADSRDLTCAECKICDGSKGPEDMRASVWINPHGSRVKRLPVLR